MAVRAGRITEENLLVGTRVQRSVVSTRSMTRTGTLIAATGSAIGRFATLAKAIPAVRVQGSRNTLLAGITLVNVAPRILRGVSTVGVDFMTVPSPQEPKPIRKYPRDWHGENMH